MTSEFAYLPHVRSEAKALGVERYFTGKPCLRGHISDRNTKTGRCYECARERSRAWAAANPELKKKRDREYGTRNSEKNAARAAAWRMDNPGAAKEWMAAHPGYSNDWKRANPERHKATLRRRYAKQREDPKLRIENSVRAGVRKGIAKGAKSAVRTFDLLGYSLADLMRHLEERFADGMSWDNYGLHGWHIDHVRPLSSFSYTTPADADFKEAWSLSNLQPLWAFDNISKHAKWTPPTAANDNSIQPAAKAA